MIAHIHTGKETFSVVIKEVKIDLPRRKEKEMWRQFHKACRVHEWTSGCTYTFQVGSHFVKSASLEELQEMWKAHYTGQEIPERKCFLGNVRPQLNNPTAR